MRLVCAFMLAGLLSLLPLALGGERASAGFECGMFDGRFQCRAAPSGEQHGKNAGQSPQTDNPDVAPAGMAAEPNATAPAAGAGTTASPEGTPDAAATACQHGMVGTPPNDCRCPKNSELLGGNCVHYTASACSNGLASDALPQACRSAEEKLSCTMREDGLKDCCCVTYDKF